MKIAVISSGMMRCPPSGYGGLELIAYLCAKGLHELGEDVTLIAPKGSKSDGFKLIETVDSPERVATSWLEPEEMGYAVYKDRLKDFDVIIDHSWYKFPYLAKVEDDSIKIIGVIHGMPVWRFPPPVRCPCLVGVSRAHAQDVSCRYGIPCKVAWNGVDLSQYPFKAEKGNRYLSLNRIMPEKGIHEFVSLMKRLRMRGDVVGEDVFVANQQYVSRIRDGCDGVLLRYFGTVPQDLKVRFLQDAKALVALPLRPYMEIFGLYCAEALSCGTPVVSLRNGGLVDQIKDGFNGFLCDSVDEVGEILKGDKLGEIKPENCRKSAEEFSVERMAKRYKELCIDVTEGREW